MKMLQVLAQYVKQLGSLWTLGIFVFSGAATFWLDQAEMEAKGYKEEALTARLLGAGLMAFGATLWGAAVVLNLLG